MVANLLPQYFTLVNEPMLPLLKYFNLQLISMKNKVSLHFSLTVSHMERIIAVPVTMETPVNTIKSQNSMITLRLVRPDQ